MGNRGEGGSEGSIGGDIFGTGGVGKRGGDNGSGSKVRNKDGIGEVERKQKGNSEARAAAVRLMGLHRLGVWTPAARLSSDSRKRRRRLL